MACTSCKEKKQTVFQQAINIAKGYTNLAISNPEIESLAIERLKICYACPEIKLVMKMKVKKKEIYKCRHKDCGCYVEAKTRVKEESCPLNKW